MRQTLENNFNRDAPDRELLHVDEVARLNLVGESPAFHEAVRLVRRIAKCDATTLIEGETGTGKELFARAVHYLGARRDAPFIPLNCGALPDSLIESELFGHEKGAFTDAQTRHPGLVAEAHRGTLFLDEVEAMSPRAQVTLLRFLQDQKYRPVGGRQMMSADVRVVAASNADLAELARRQLFRDDLLFRLRVLHLGLPPLRKRIGDAALLARTFLARLSRLHGGTPRRLHPASLRWLGAYEWPGNVRELESLILREFHLSDEEEIVLGDPRAPRSAAATDADAGTDARVPFEKDFKRAKAQAVAQFERTYLCRILELSEGNVSRAARQSGKDRSAINKLVKKHGLVPGEFRAAQRVAGRTGE